MRLIFALLAGSGDIEGGDDDGDDGDRDVESRRLATEMATKSKLAAVGVQMSARAKCRL